MLQDANEEGSRTGRGSMARNQSPLDTSEERDASSGGPKSRSKTAASESEARASPKYGNIHPRGADPSLQCDLLPSKRWAVRSLMLRSSFKGGLFFGQGGVGQT